MFQIKSIFWCLGTSALLLSGCNQTNQAASEPAPQKITEATPTSVAVNEPAAVLITQATPSANGKSAASGIATQRSKSLAAFDMKQFHLARTLELPYYNDTISSLVFSPDGKTIAGAGRGAALDSKNIAERGIVFLFDVKSGKLLRRLAAPTTGSHITYFDRAIWSPDGKFVAGWNPDHATDNAISLCVWDAQSGQRTAWFNNPQWGVSAVAWARDGSLLVARSQVTDLTSTQGQLMVCDGQHGQIKSIFDLGAQVVSWIGIPQQGPPQMLVLKQIGGDGKTQAPLYQSSLRQWLGSAWSQPVFQLKPNAVFWGAAFVPDNLIALSGFEQSDNSKNWGEPIRNFYILSDLKTRKIIWQKTREPLDMSTELSLSPDAKQIFARVMTIRPKLIFNVSNGATSSLPMSDFPFFAPDGKRFVRLLDSGKHAPNGQLLPDGKKPNLKIAEIWER